MYRLNNNGPRGDSCGMPLRIVATEDSAQEEEDDYFHS